MHHLTSFFLQPRWPREVQEHAKSHTTDEGWSRAKNQDSPAANVVGELNPGATTVPRVWLWHIYTAAIRVASRVILLNPCELEKD